MRLLRPLLACACVAVVSAAAAAPASALEPDARYALVHNCYDLRSVALGHTVATDIGPFRMQATALGKYLLYGKRGDFLGLDALGRVGSVAAPSDSTNWTVDVRGDSFTLTLPDGKALTTDAVGLTTGAAGAFTFEPAQGCATFPEAPTNVTGDPSTAPGPYGEVKGLIDAHMHWMAYEFLGGKAHCGKPWDQFGITVALVDCPDHSIPGSPGNVLETALGGKPTHDTVGWPTFGYWPNYYSETHEGTYYKWVERAWRAGLRIFVNLYVDNQALCEVYPEKSHGCNEMDTVRLEMKRLHELKDYVDAQAGGPGKGFFDIVHSPFEARKVVAAGKLAVVEGIEVSTLFDCGIYNGIPQCDGAKVKKQLDDAYAEGVRSMELVNKFDNAFVGVAGDDGTQGEIVNAGNKLITGQYWDMQTCRGLPPDVHDKTQYTVPSPGRDLVVAGLFGPLAPAGAGPVYPPPPHCNARGLSSLGTELIEGMMNKGMIIDPDHMSVAARNSTLDLLEARKYSGVVSSHSWSTPDAYPRIYKLGGFVTPIAGSSTGFVKEYKTLKAERDPRYYWGFGYGADMNGFHSLGGPRTGAKDPVTYPFKSIDGKQTIDKETTGKRTWDINVDGTAHYGLFPDWWEDLRHVGGDAIVQDMDRGAEAYLEMWERAVGVPVQRALPARVRLTGKGLWKVRLGLSNEALLRSAGQPAVRGARAWRYRVQERDGRPAGRVIGVLDADGRSTFVGSTGPEHAAAGIRPGDHAKVLRGMRSIGHGLRTRSAGGGAVYVYGVRGGHVRFVGVADRAIARSASALRAYVKLAGLA